MEETKEHDELGRDRGRTGLGSGRGISPPYRSVTRPYSHIRQVCKEDVYAMSCNKCEIPPHVHSVPRLSFVLSGHTVEIDDRRRKTPSGPLTVVYQPPGWKHAHMVETELSTLCFDLSQRLLARFSEIARDLERPIISGSPRIVNAGLRMHQEMWAEDSASNLVLEGLLIELVGECARQPRPNVALTPPKWLRHARELLNDRFRDRLTLDEIAAAVAIDPSHLSRMFRAHYGETVGEFSRRLRLEDGLRQLAATKAPISEIAANAGFCDHAHFSRECQRVLGVSPRDIRRSM